MVQTTKKKKTNSNVAIRRKGIALISLYMKYVSCDALKPAMKLVLE
jgi:hypothetical protein